MNTKNFLKLFVIFGIPIGFIFGIIFGLGRYFLSNWDFPSSLAYGLFFFVFSNLTAGLYFAYIFTKETTLSLYFDDNAEFLSNITKTLEKLYWFPISSIETLLISDESCLIFKPKSKFSAKYIPEISLKLELNSATMKGSMYFVRRVARKNKIYMKNEQKKQNQKIGVIYLVCAITFLLMSFLPFANIYSDSNSELQHFGFTILIMGGWSGLILIFLSIYSIFTFNIINSIFFGIGGCGLIGMNLITILFLYYRRIVIYSQTVVLLFPFYIDFIIWLIFCAVNIYIYKQREKL